VEALLLQLVVALGVIVVLSQVLLTMPGARYVMSYVDRLEGVALDPGGPSVTVLMSRGNPGHAAYLLVNGQRASSFALGIITVGVNAGDLLEVDGTGLDGDGTFQVAATTGGVLAPAKGSEVVTHRGVTSLGRVEAEGGS